LCGLLYLGSMLVKWLTNPSLTLGESDDSILRAKGRASGLIAERAARLLEERSSAWSGVEGEVKSLCDRWVINSAAVIATAWFLIGGMWLNPTAAGATAPLAATELKSLADEADLSRSTEGQLFEDDSHSLHEELSGFESDHGLESEHEGLEWEHGGEGEHGGGEDGGGDSGGDREGGGD
jgi:hypothetical protein